MTSTSLTPEQTHALFDILSHYETYREIESFKFPDAVTGYGYPFSRQTVVPLGGWKSAATTPANSVPGTPRSRTPVPPTSASVPSSVKGDENDEDDDAPSTSPILQTLLTRFILKLPGVKNLSRDFWAVRVQGLLARLGDAELSESYDKGALGTRKTLATGASGLIEMLGRGAFGGVKRKREDGAEGKRTRREYDKSNAEELVRAWDDAVDELIYGNLVDDMFDHLSKTDDLEAQSPAIKAAAEYAIIHLATLIHQIFVLSPEGQYLLKLLENVHNLIPYKMVKQTLRVGNAATMISAMMRLLLAKLSVTSITNWVGLTANADDGMNLLQRIISLVLSWDAGEFRKSADKVEKAKDGPSEEMLQAIREYVAQSRIEHETVRNASEEHAQSIITAIFNASNPDLTKSLTEQKHTQCLEYYSALLSVRDRDGITTAFCRQPPDLFTAAIKDLIAAYEPLIRTIHAGVDLREHVEAGQAFIDDFIRTSKPKKADGTSTPLRSMIGGEKPVKMASVDDYVELLMRHRGVLYKWIHSLASKCPDIWRDLRHWNKEVVVRFQQKPAEEAPEETKATPLEPLSAAAKDQPSQTINDSVVKPTQSAMDARLNNLLQALPSSSQPPILAALDAHSKYLATVTAASTARLQRILDCSDSNMSGPGVYLARWQSLLDQTHITPGTPQGAVRYGKDVKHTTTMGKTGAPGAVKAREVSMLEMESIEAPDVEVVIKELGLGFTQLVQELGGR